MHGPKSVLCTKVLPLECTLCVPPSPRLQTKASFESYTTQIQDDDDDDDEPQRAAPRLRRTDTDFTLPPGLSHASTAVEGRPITPTIEQHPLFRRGASNQTSHKYPYGWASGPDTCASCSFTVPPSIAAKLPEGAPGSLRDGGKSKNAAPVLRSREFICLGKSRKYSQSRHYQHLHPSSSQESDISPSSSVGSTLSQHAANHCHDHTLTYLTSKSPDDPTNYATLRASVLRALSCEVLPRGLSEGPFCFGDSTTGYTIAYVFRLTDPKARGRRRAYAFVALAGRDAHRAFKACPMLWEAFATMAKAIELAAQRYQDEQELERQKEREEEMAKDNKSAYTNISSFLTQRPVDPDGHPRRVGQTMPRSLAEIIGDENIFAILHQYFVAVLRCLGDQFGGLPLAERKQKMAYQTVASEQDGVGESNLPRQVSNDMLDALKIEDEEELVAGKRKPQAASTGLASQSMKQQASAKVAITPADLFGDTTSTTSTSSTPKKIKRNSQCGSASLTLDSNRQRQVAV